jgi:hypothetical protein
MATPALYVPTGVIVDVIQDGDEDNMAYVKFPTKKVLWVKAVDLNFEFDLADDTVGRDNFDPLGRDLDGDIRYDIDEPIDYFDDYDPVDYYDCEYDLP